MIATQPEDRSSWLRHGIVADARERYDVPIQHVVVHTGWLTEGASRDARRTRTFQEGYSRPP